MFSIKFHCLARRIDVKNVLKCEVRYLRQMPKTIEQFNKMKNKEIEQPVDPKLLRVALIGCPNAGKSTLLNEIIRWNVSAVSSKVHTTKSNVIGVFSADNTQIEFIDTPGVVSRKHISKHKLADTFKYDPEKSLTNVDIIAFVTDISNKREQFHINAGILNLLSQNRDKESILILNKVDKIQEKRRLIDFTAALTSGIVNGESIVVPDYKMKRERIKKGDFEEIFKKTEEKLKNPDSDSKIILPQEDGKGWPNFSRVFMVSALNNDGVETLRSFFLSKATHRPWLYNEDSVTTSPPKELIVDAIRQVCLDILYSEIPYEIKHEIVFWELDELGNLHIAVDMFCPEKFVSLIIGPKGSNISTIVRRAREALCSIFHCDVSLKLAAKPLLKKKN